MIAILVGKIYCWIFHTDMEQFGNPEFLIDDTNNGIFSSFECKVASLKNFSYVPIWQLRLGLGKPRLRWRSRIPDTFVHISRHPLSVQIVVNGSLL